MDGEFAPRCRAGSMGAATLLKLLHLFLLACCYRSATQQSHRRLQQDWPVRAQPAQAAQMLGLLDVQPSGLDAVQLSSHTQDGSRPWHRQHRRQQQEQERDEDDEEQAARADPRAAAIMDALLQDMLDAEAAVVAHTNMHCSCDYGSLPGVWLPPSPGSGGGGGPSWALLEGDCVLEDLTSAGALRRRVDESAGPLQVRWSGHAPSAAARPAAAARGAVAPTTC